MELSDDDKKDIIQAAVRNLIAETNKLGVKTLEVSELLGREDAGPAEMLLGVTEVLALNTHVTMTLGSVVMAHLNATGMLKEEVKLHS